MCRLVPGFCILRVPFLPLSNLSNSIAVPRWYDQRSQARQIPVTSIPPLPTLKMRPVTDGAVVLALLQSAHKTVPTKRSYIVYGGILRRDSLPGLRGFAYKSWLLYLRLLLLACSCCRWCKHAQRSNHRLLAGNNIRITNSPLSLISLICRIPRELVFIEPKLFRIDCWNFKSYPQPVALSGSDSNAREAFIMHYRRLIA